MGDEEENRERLEAEFEFIAAAYEPQEAWIDRSTNTTTTAALHRKLDLCLEDSRVSVELILTIPDKYPSEESLKIDATVSTANTNNNNHFHRKLVLDALPSLLDVCRKTAVEAKGGEAFFLVFSTADQWIEEEWSKVAANITPAAASSIQVPSPQLPKTIKLGRKLIYSHHIIAKSKRRAIGDLSKDYRLGGYYKIGWPGIIVLEGALEDCEGFWAELRKLRWQYLVVKGEEHESIQRIPSMSPQEQVDSARLFSLPMIELDEDQMSYLSERCKEVGLEALFRTALKLSSAPIEEEEESSLSCESNPSYGTLLLVDHMNDPKGYTKWIRKSCQSVGCKFLLLFFGSHQSPFIFVVLRACEKRSIQQLLKRWRTSYVDVDSKGNPCLERKMDVLAEGPLDAANNSNPSFEQGTQTVSQSQLESILDDIGGSTWVTAMEDTIANRFS